MEVITRAEARERGLKHYFTGKPCSKGHVAQRLLSSKECLGCRKLKAPIKNAAARAAPKTPLQGEAKVRRQASQARWLAENAERQKENIRRWRERNKERTAETNAAWMAANRDRHNKAVADLKQRYPERVRVYAHNRRARIADDAELDSEVVRQLWVAQEGRCACPCQADLRQGYHIDHILAIIRGGRNVADNLQLLTPLCNLIKGTKENAVFMVQQKAKFDANT